MEPDHLGRQMIDFQQCGTWKNQIKLSKEHRAKSDTSRFCIKSY